MIRVAWNSTPRPLFCCLPLNSARSPLSVIGPTSDQPTGAVAGPMARIQPSENTTLWAFPMLPALPSTLAHQGRRTYLSLSSPGPSMPSWDGHRQSRFPPPPPGSTCTSYWTGSGKPSHWVDGRITYRGMFPNQFIFIPYRPSHPWKEGQRGKIKIHPHDRARGWSVA